ncbi:hypothetical protein [Paenibacillus sp. FSL H7-0331]|uniref:hypothetical protein n=1 Tax=Paenibacillus sp. FSL H7-0331 TaxID=1920421 RepID=UPI0015C32391|nr:hypothetical protein [Paenibacillus sp. FSL H7-0331]
MSINYYSELKKIDDEDLRLKLLMRTIKNLLVEKKNRSFFKKLIYKKPKTQPKG